MAPMPMPINQHIYDRLHYILDPYETLCKKDIIWMLDFVKKRVADEDPMLMALPQPRLLKKFHYFAEISMMLIHDQRCGGNLEEKGRIKQCLNEMLYGICPLR